MSAAGFHAVPSDDLTSASSGPRALYRLGRGETLAQQAVGARPDGLVIDAGDDDASLLRAADIVREARTIGSLGPVYVRISPLALGRTERELDALVPAGPTGFMLPETVGLRDVDRLSVKVAVREAEYGWPDGAIAILAVMGDSAAGILALSGLPYGPSRRLVGIVLDPDALAQDLGAGRDAAALAAAEASTILFARAINVTPVVLVPETGEPDLPLWAAAGFDMAVVADQALVGLARAVFAGSARVRRRSGA